MYILFLFYGTQNLMFRQYLLMVHSNSRLVIICCRIKWFTRRPRGKNEASPSAGFLWSMCGPPHSLSSALKEFQVTRVFSVFSNMLPSPLPPTPLCESLKFQCSVNKKTRNVLNQDAATPPFPTGQTLTQDACKFTLLPTQLCHCKYTM